MEKTKLFLVFSILIFFVSESKQDLSPSDFEQRPILDPEIYTTTMAIAKKRYAMLPEELGGGLEEYEINPDSVTDNLAKNMLNKRTIASTYQQTLQVPYGKIDKFANWLNQIPRASFLDCPTNEKRFGLTCTPESVSRSDLDNYFCGSAPEQYGLCGIFWAEMGTPYVDSSLPVFNNTVIRGPGKRGISHGNLPLPLVTKTSVAEMGIYFQMLMRLCNCHCGCTSGCFNNMPYQTAATVLHCGRFVAPLRESLLDPWVMLQSAFGIDKWYPTHHDYDPGFKKKFEARSLQDRIDGIVEQLQENPLSLEEKENLLQQLEEAKDSFGDTDLSRLLNMLN